MSPNNFIQHNIKEFKIGTVLTICVYFIYTYKKKMNYYLVNCYVDETSSGNGKNGVCSSDLCVALYFMMEIHLCACFPMYLTVGMMIAS